MHIYLILCVPFPVKPAVFAVAATLAFSPMMKVAKVRIGHVPISSIF